MREITDIKAERRARIEAERNFMLERIAREEAERKGRQERSAIEEAKRKGGQERSAVEEAEKNRRQKEESAEEKKPFYKSVVDSRIEDLDKIIKGQILPEDLSIREAVIEALGAMDAAEKAGVEISEIKRKIIEKTKEAYLSMLQRNVDLLNKIARKEKIIYSPEYLLSLMKETLEDSEEVGIDTVYFRKVYDQMLEKFKDQLSVINQ